MICIKNKLGNRSSVSVGSDSIPNNLKYYDGKKQYQKYYIRNILYNCERFSAYRHQNIIGIISSTTI